MPHYPSEEQLAHMRRTIEAWQPEIKCSNALINELAAVCHHYAPFQVEETELVDSDGKAYVIQFSDEAPMFVSKTDWCRYERMSGFHSKGVEDPNNLKPSTGGFTSYVGWRSVSGSRKDVKIKKQERKTNEPV